MGTLLQDNSSLIILDGGYGASFNSGYLQGNYFIGLGDNIYFGVIGRFNYLTFDDLEYSFNLFEDSLLINRFAPDSHSAIIGQIGAEFKFDGDKVGGFAQINTAFDNNDEQYFTTRRLSLNVGVSFKLDQIFNFWN